MANGRQWVGVGLHTPYTGFEAGYYPVCFAGAGYAATRVLT